MVRRTHSTDDTPPEQSVQRAPADASGVLLYTDGGTPRQNGTQRSVLSEDTLKQSFPDYDGQVRHSTRLDGRAATTVPAGDVVADGLADRLEYDLFSHQAEALAHLARDDNVVVTTSTSSGKTWIYALQIARNYRVDPDSTALCLYPMKALTRDQENELNTKLRDDWGTDATIGVYDGDTTTERKRRIRENANVILTNPAGLNVYLPRHNQDSGWHRFYSNLELVVIDEGHEYSGVTGTHVAWIVRRLRRLLAHYDADPQFVITTATIGNPADHATQLTGAEFTVVDEDGSPRGNRDIVLWEPPLDDAELDDDSDDPLADFEQARRSAGAEAASVTAHLAVNGVQTLQFCTARQGTEIAAKQTVQAASDHPSEAYVSVDPYHAGLGKRERRAVENRLKTASVDAVASTNALELGIDIGSVDATVASSYPGTKQSFWQQVGRAGRGRSDALSVLIGGQDAIDAYILDNPAYLFEDDTIEDAVVSINNDRVYADHLLAAAAERPLSVEDAPYLGGEQRLRETVSMWQDAGLLEQTATLDTGGVTYTGDARPQGRLSLYGTGGVEFTITCENGEIDHDPVAEERAYRDYHVGALFLHAGQQYEVTDVDRGGHHPVITVRETNTDEYTQTNSTKRLTDLDVTEHRSLAGTYDLYFGTGTVRITYDTYLVRNVFTGEVARGPLPTNTPPIDLRTELMWVTLPEAHLSATIETLDEPLLEPTSRSQSDPQVPTEEARYTYGGGLHAAEHGIIQLAPLELMIDNNDIGGLSLLQHQHETVPGPAWFVHDGIDGGIGYTRAIYEHFETLAARTREHIEDCVCGRRRGCPLCVMSEDCGNNNDPLDTVTGTMILDDVLDAIQ
jgi:DEAD/DEAH box helicase domain-containing protein